jgi:hypothetical protein
MRNEMCKFNRTPLFQRNKVIGLTVAYKVFNTEHSCYSREVPGLFFPVFMFQGSMRVPLGTWLTDNKEPWDAEPTGFHVFRTQRGAGAYMRDMGWKRKSRVVRVFVKGEVLGIGRWRWWWWGHRGMRVREMYVPMSSVPSKFQKEATCLSTY